jgi:hypothetical protein
MRKLALILFLAVAAQSQGAMTLLFREMFARTGTLTSGAPGSNFTSVTGTLYQRAGGPRLSAGSAASVDLQGAGTTYGRYDPSNPNNSKVFFGAWFYFKSLGTSGANGNMHLWMEDQFGNPAEMIEVKAGELGAGILGNTFTACPIDPTNQWVFFGIALSRTSGATGDLKFYYKTVGGSMTAWATVSAGNIAIGTTGRLKVGASNATPVSYFRVGGVAAYTFAQSDFSDVVYPPDLLEPSTGLTWYVNPATGSDSNDGADAAHAWQTAAKINAESANCGLFQTASYPTGDTLVIDTSAGNLDVTSDPIVIQTGGLNVRAATDQTWAVIQPWKTIAPGSWSTTGTDNVYSTTDAIALACLWEDDKWLTHPNGEKFEAVSATLGRTAGSFYVDAEGTTLYVHPFGNTDPRVDGKTYTRSHAGITTAAFSANAPNVNVQDLYIRKTCDVDAATGAPNAGYSIAGTGAWSGTNLIKHCYVDYFGKHGIGLVANSLSNEVTTIDAVQSEQGSPYGAQSPFVSFNSNVTTPTGIRHVYQNCTSLKETGLIGSTAGTHSTNSILLSHNNGTGTQFSNISVLNCNFSNGSLSLGVTESSTITGTTVGDIAVNDPACTITRCHIDRAGISQSYSTGPILIVQNCLFTPTDAMGSASSFTQGTSTWEANTIDLNGVTGADTQAGFLKRTAASTITFRNNAVTMPAAKSYTIFQAYLNTDTLTVTNNAYRLGQNTQVAFQYNDGSTTAARTFAQWQVLGFDANSINSTNLLLSTSYRPLRGSALIDAGTSLGSLVDYTGRLFNPRNDIGAYEFMATNAGVQRRGGRRY